MLSKSHRSVVSTCVLIFMPYLKKKIEKKHLFFFREKNTIRKKQFFFFCITSCATTDRICLDFLRWVTPGYSVAITDLKAAIHYASWRAAPRTISAPNGHEQGECVVRPLIKSVLIFWGEWVRVTPGYSVAIALPLYKVWCISAPPWIGSERRYYDLLIQCYRNHPCLWNSTLIYYKCKDRLKWYKNTEIRLRK